MKKYDCPHCKSIIVDRFEESYINTPLNIIEYDGDKIVYYKFVLVDENAIEHIELNLLAAAILLDNF